MYRQPYQPITKNTMNIEIKIKGGAGAGFTMTPAIQEYASKRFESFSKFLKDDPAAFIVVELAKTNEHHKSGDIYSAEVHVVGKIGGKASDLYSTAQAADLYAAIDAVRDEAFREISSTKSKHTTLMRRSGAKIKNALKGLIGRNHADGSDSM